MSLRGGIQCPHGVWSPVCGHHCLLDHVLDLLGAKDLKMEFLLVKNKSN